MRWLVFFAFSVYAASAVKFMLSTDPGADDAEALIYMITYGRKDIAAFLPTHGNGNVGLSITNCWRILKLMNATNIPVYAGSARGFNTVPEPSTWFGSDALGDIPNTPPTFDFATDMPKILANGHAANAIVDFAKKNPGELVILLQASLTDLALAYMLEPKLPQLMNKTIIIGGNMNAKGNAEATVEFNFFADPIAAKIVVDNFSPMLIPYEVAQAKTMTWPWHDQTWLGQGTKLGNFLTKAEMPATLKLKASNTPYAFADQIAPPLALDPSLITKSTKLPATVEINGDLTTGMTVVDFRAGQTATKNLELVLDFDMEKVKERYVAAFGPNPPSSY